MKDLDAQRQLEAARYTFEDRIQQWRDGTINDEQFYGHCMNVASIMARIATAL